MNSLLPRFVLDAKFWVKNLLLLKRRYSFHRQVHIDGNTLYLIFDDGIKYPGMADRLKAICCLYFIARENGFKFKIIENTGFQLSKFLYSQEKYDWLGKKEELSHCVKDCRIISNYSSQRRIPRLNRKIHQYHVYYINGGGDVLSRIYSETEYPKRWKEVFDELFSPNEQLTRSISGSLGEIGKYYSVHLRFVNALENFEPEYANQLEEAEKNQLVTRCLDTIRNLSSKYPGEWVVFSDSGRFLGEAARAGFRVAGGGKVTHISVRPSGLEKALVDFFLISGSAEVYSIISKEMYVSAFPAYAAFAGGKQFHRIRI